MLQFFVSHKSNLIIFSRKREKLISEKWSRFFFCWTTRLSGGEPLSRIKLLSSYPNFFFKRITHLFEFNSLWRNFEKNILQLNLILITLFIHCMKEMYSIFRSISVRHQNIAAWCISLLCNGTLLNLILEHRIYFFKKLDYFQLPKKYFQVSSG